MTFKIVSEGDCIHLLIHEPSRAFSLTEVRALAVAF